jgi:hypothetical protein
METKPKAKGKFWNIGINVAPAAKQGPLVRVGKPKLKKGKRCY